MKISVIIPCYNAAATIGEQLEALTHQRWNDDWEIVVADNGSSDASIRIIEEFQKRLRHLRVVDASKERGCGSAKNVGVKFSSGEVCLFCDADDQVAPGWLEAMGEALLIHALVVCRYDHLKLNPPWASGIRGATQVNGLQKLRMPTFSYGGGGTIGIARLLHDAIGGFDPTCTYSEDIDYCIKAQLRGIELHFANEAVVHYRGKTRLKDIYGQARNWAQDEMLILKKYCPQSCSELWRWRAYLTIWWALLTHLPQLLRTPGGRGLCMWRLGRQIGFLKGSVRYGMSPIVES